MRGLYTFPIIVTLTIGCGDKGRDLDSTGGKPRRDAGTDAGAELLPDGGQRPPRDGGPYEPPPLTPESTDWVKDATKDAGLSDAVLDVLKKGADRCTAKIIYPYEGTVFPVGLLPPTIMWEGDSEAAYLRLAYDRVTTVDYQLAGGATQKGSLTIPADDWNRITRRSQGTPLRATLTTKRGSTLSTCKTAWTIAQGGMVGSIYYNTYNHPSSNGMGAVMRLTLGRPEADVYLSFRGLAVPGTGPCVSCHSISSGGATIAASTHNYAPIVQSFETASYDITTAPQPNPTTKLPESTFGGLTPDGALMLGMGNPDCTAGADAFPRSPNNFPLLAGPSKASLFDARTGRPVAARGLRDDWYMWMPQFSPKGDKVVFNHAKPGLGGRTDRRELAVMDYDARTRTFSNLKVLVSRLGPEPTLDYRPAPTLAGPNPTGAGGCTTPVANAQGAMSAGTCTGPCYPAWPFFTPDGEGVVFSLISEPDFTLAFPGRDRPSKSELWYVDVASGERARLDNANKGLAPGDALANYYPTMLPVQVGGYFWMFWTSTRNYGHVDLSPNLGQLISNPFGGVAALEATRKRIWVSALRPRSGGGEIGPGEVQDISAPAFYLDGQSATGNVRAFAALNPCKPVGNDCASGLDCCTGYCNIDDTGTSGQCTDEPPECADINERCDEDADCCQATDPMAPTRSCIGNYCGFVVVI